MLARDDAEWDRLRTRMNAKNDAQFEALRAGFRAGIPAPKPIDEVAADRMLQLMVERAGEKLLGQPPLFSLRLINLLLYYCY